ncbi:hypothetical protein KP509_23G073100 [Ceratopteris richardii]|uniref:CASP-like protein n=1 Tax=Ceratopteris richardii TaxID=49495 RepID=A0A8T2S129_CERRI|nr:hypothetical protein KP509_23G073100 [Ceratopteris richardii]
MEHRTTHEKLAPDRSPKANITPEATASSLESPPFDDSEPPPLEEVSEPHSKASTPPSSTPHSEDLEKGFSPSSPYTERIGSQFSSSERELSPSSYEQNVPSPPSDSQEVNSPSSLTEKVYNQSSFTEEGHSGGRQNNAAPVQIKSPPAVEINDLNHTQTKAGIGSLGNTVSKEKLDLKPSLRTPFASIRHSVSAAAKHVSFKSDSISSRTSAAIYGEKPWWKRVSHQMKIIEAALRAGGAILALISFSVMCATSEWRQGAGSTFKMSFTDYQAYNYLVAINVISFVYSCFQSFAVWQSYEIGIAGTARRKLTTHVCDQVLAFLLFSASTAAATAAQLSRHGLRNIWPPACATWSLWHFCSKADAAVAMSFFSSLFVISSAVYSGYHTSDSLS